MQTTRDDRPPVTPTQDTVDFAQRVLHGPMAKHARFALVDAETNTKIEMPEQVYELLRRVLIELAMNRPLSILPLAHELTTHQAAELLGVSRGFVLGLIEKQELKCRKVGTHRRIRLEDLLAYEARSNAEAEQAANDVTALGQELGLD